MLVGGLAQRHAVGISRTLIEAVASASPGAATELVQILYDFVQNPEGASPSGQHDISSQSERAQETSPISFTSFPSHKLSKVRFSLTREQDENLSDPREQQVIVPTDQGSPNTREGCAHRMWTQQPKTPASVPSYKPIQAPPLASEQPSMQQQSLQFGSPPQTKLPYHIPAYDVHNSAASPVPAGYQPLFTPIDTLPVHVQKAGHALQVSGQGSQQPFWAPPHSLVIQAATPHGNREIGNQKACRKLTEHTSHVSANESGLSATQVWQHNTQQNHVDIENVKNGSCGYHGHPAPWPEPFATGWGPWGNESGIYQATCYPPQWEPGGGSHVWHCNGGPCTGELGPLSGLMVGSHQGDNGTAAAPRFEFDRQPRPVDFKPYTVTDYRLREYDVKLQSGYWTLGTLGGKADEADVQVEPLSTPLKHLAHMGFLFALPIPRPSL